MTKHTNLRAVLSIICLNVMLGPMVNRATGQVPNGPRQVAKGPKESLAELQVADGFEVQLVAAEPQIVDPVTARFDSHGRLWVVEMRDYPTPPGDGQFNGQIKVLSDADGDGFFEHASVFAEQLAFPTGLQPFRDGVILTHAGKVSYLADTDGDLVCDLQQDWFTGFSTGNEQLRANHPTWTMEGLIHVASGLRGGEVLAVDGSWNATPKPLSLTARDFQFSPFGGDWTAVAGNSQFGFYQDSGLRNYVCSNRNPCDLLLAQPWQITNNPLLPLSNWTVNVMPVAEQSQVFPLVNAWTTSNLHAGTFTAACGVFRYESDRLADQLDGDFFACEPTGSLVQRYRTASESIFPKAGRAHENSEFLASTDPWFRPVDLLDGPDGALYVVDMHRAVIEHPDWMPEELKQREDLSWGKDAGRIYRIVPAQKTASLVTPIVFENMANKPLVHALFSPNRWQRTTASRLISERLHQPGSEERAALIDQLINAILNRTDSPADTSAGLCACLWLLHSHDALTHPHLVAASKSSDPSVRSQAVRLLAKLPRSSQQQLSDELIANLASDPHPLVRFQWLLEFANSAKTKDIEAVLKLVRTSRNDSSEDQLWLGRALSLLSAEAAESVGLRLLADHPAQADQVLLEPLLKRLGWEGNTAIASGLLVANNHPQNQTWRQSYLDGMLVRGLTWSRITPNLNSEATKNLERWIVSDQQTAADDNLEIESRVAALQRLAADGSTETIELCKNLIQPQQPRLFIAALRILEKSPDPALPEELVGYLDELPPDASYALLQAFIRRATWTPTLLSALESKQVPFNLIDPATRGRLARHPSSDIANRFNAIAKSLTKGNLQLVMQRYHAAVDEIGDVARGKTLFKTHCAACHRIDSEGHQVGPDVSDLRTQTPSQILLSILDPNAAIDAAYYRYSVLTLDGQVIEGLLIDSDPASVTLKLQQGESRTIQRAAIELFRTTGVSMMPEGFENQLSPEAMRDLITYLKRWRFEDGNIPVKAGN